jgi:hypothetical protein
VITKLIWEEKLSSKHQAVLEELLTDPIIRLVMASDGVHADEIRRLFKEVSTRTFRCALPAGCAMEAA